MIIGIGTDIIEVSRIAKLVDKYGDKFLKRIYTPTEIDYCESFTANKYLHYAARFASKEAFSKAIGTGITEGFKFNEVGVVNEENGKPNIELRGSLAEKWGSYKTHITLSHTVDNAVAFLVMEK